MARNKLMHDRLDRWSVWRESDKLKSRGYPSKCPMFREVKQDGYHETHVPFIGEEESITNDAVESMRFCHPDLHATIMLYYGNGRKTLREQAVMLCCSESAIRARLERIDAYLVQWLSDHKHGQHPRIREFA